MTSTIGSHSPEERSSHVCNCCEGIVDSLEFPKIKDPDDGRGYANTEFINVGWLDSIIDHSADCSFCRLITRIWETVRLPETDNLSESASDAASPPAGGAPQRKYVGIDHSSPTPLTPTERRVFWNICVEFFYPGRKSESTSSIPVRTKWEPRFSLLAEDWHLLKHTDVEQACLLGRLRSTDQPCDRSFLESCFKMCVNEHGRACSEPIRQSTSRSFPLRPSAPLPPDMKVIDVIDQRLIPRLEDTDYIVLSYVWGNSNFLTLTTSNIAQLSTPGGLRHARKPKTIAHAMEATLALGMRYIWIDSLCIIQDSAQDKARLLARMDDIYTAAALTIIAAGSNEADAGLWRQLLATRAPQIVEEVRGLRFVALEPALACVLEHSVYNQRGWTYQEFVLSKRLLVFSESQAYYSCEQAASAEDYVDRLCSDGSQVLNRTPADTEVIILADQAENFPTYWRNLVKEYTNRRLTFEADGLNAARGVIAAYCRSINESSVCGLLLSVLFEYSLLWFPTRTLKRRLTTKGTEAFPSWSWLGWVGQVQYEGLDDDEGIRNGRVIDKWSLYTTQIDRVKHILHSSHGQVHCTRQPTGESKSTPQPCQTGHGCAAGIETGLLCFTALSAHFEIGPVYLGQFVNSDDHKCEHTGIHQVLHNQRWIGGIHLEHAVAEELLEDNNRPGSSSKQHQELIVLSVSSGGAWYIPRRSAENPDETDFNADWTPLFDEDLISEYEYDDGDAVAEAYNVMLVVRRDGIASRAGIGQVHKWSFDEAGPTLGCIQLG